MGIANCSIQIFSAEAALMSRHTSTLALLFLSFARSPSSFDGRIAWVSLISVTATSGYQNSDMARLSTVILFES